MGIRTDLAVEAKALYEHSVQSTTKLSGVIARSSTQAGVRLSRVQIMDHRGEKALGKPRGTYVTLELPRKPDCTQRQHAAKMMAEELEKLLELKEAESALLVGLGNRSITPDAIGPMSVDGVFLTRHLLFAYPELFRPLRSVCAVMPGVLADTGLESQELTLAAVRQVKPDCVVVVDALASCQPEHLCSTIQLTDTGIAPGSGVSNARPAFNKQSLGVRVVAIGVPTVMDDRACSGTWQEQSLMVTPRDIDARVESMAQIVSEGINRALFPKEQFAMVQELQDYG